MRIKVKKTPRTDKRALKLTRQIGQSINTVLQSGGVVEVKVNQNHYDPWHEPEPEIPDWLK